MRMILVLVLMSCIFAGTTMNFSASQPPGRARVPFDYSASPDVGGSNNCFDISLNKLAVSGWGGWAVWDLATAKRLSTGKVKSFNAHCIAISPDGKTVAVGGDGDIDPNAELKLFDADTGQFQSLLGGHLCSMVQVGFTADGKHLVSLADDNILRVWRVSDRKPLVKCCFNSNFQTNLRLRWRTYVDRPQDKAENEVVHEMVTQGVYRFAISPDGKTIALTTGTQEVFLLETLTGKLLKRHSCEKIKSTVSIRYSPDGSLLGIGGALKEGFVEIWKTGENKLVAVLDKHESSVLCLAISQNNQYVVSGGMVDGARVWEISSGKLMYRLQHEVTNGFEIRIQSVAFMADGKTVAILRHENPVRFWDLATGKAVDPTKLK